MNEYAILHIPDSNYCFATGKRQLTLRLRTQKNDSLEEVSVIHGCKYDFHCEREETPLQKKYSDRLFDYYEAALDLKDVRFAYIFKLTEKGQIKYYCEDGVTETYDFNRGFYNFFQLPYINEADMPETVDWMKSAVFYQIFVDRFYRGSQEKDDSYINMKWGDKPTPKSFAGGDIRGIIKKLDYIRGLGVNTIYLTPIFTSASNHKYDISDYKQVDPQFGSNQDLKELVEEIHKRGMHIVLDAVFNHCSSQMMQFQDVVEKGKASPYYDWFLIDGEYPQPHKRNYECFGACEYMPKLNSSNEKVREFLLDIGCFWIEEYDIDGWRLDVSDEVSHDFWRIFRKEIKKRKKDCVIIGENWHDAYPFLMGDQYDSIMNYAFTKASLDYFASGIFDAGEFAEKLNQILMRNKTQVNRMMMNLLDSHDTHRFYTEVGKDRNKLLAAIAVMTVFTGAPCIYYGTEICTEGGYDPDSRRTFDWEKAGREQEFQDKIKEILLLKHSRALQDGEISITAVNGVLRLLREIIQETGGKAEKESRKKIEKEAVLLLHSRDYAMESAQLEAAAGTKIKEAEVLASHLYNGQTLQQGGFIVLRMKAVY